jgi:dihydrofolate reductase
MTEINYNMIVATDLYRGIGKNNELPWYFPEDLKNFSKLTRGEGNNAIVMGRNTWDSLPKKPLPKRDNLILSTTLNVEENSPKNTYVKSFVDLSSLEVFCKSQNYDTVWIIGGQKVYDQFICEQINSVYLTLIHKDYKCDTWFPSLLGWNLIDNKEIIRDNIKVCYQVYKRNKNGI